MERKPVNSSSHEWIQVADSLMSSSSPPFSFPGQPRKTNNADGDGFPMFLNDENYEPSNEGAMFGFPDDPGMMQDEAEVNHPQQQQHPGRGNLQSPPSPPVHPRSAENGPDRRRPDGSGTAAAGLREAEWSGFQGLGSIQRPSTPAPAAIQEDLLGQAECQELHAMLQNGLQTMVQNLENLVR